MKKILISLSFALMLAAVGFGIAGCATNANLAPNGAYSNDAFLYNVDSVVISSYSSIDAFLVFETANENYFKTNSPATFALANTIRAKTPKILSDINIARTAYVKYFSETNASFADLQSASNTLSSALTEITSEATSTSTVSTNITQ